MEWSALGLGPGETAVVDRLPPAISERKRVSSVATLFAVLGRPFLAPAEPLCHICDGRYVTFQMAEVVMSRQTLADIVMLTTRLRAAPVPA